MLKVSVMLSDWFHRCRAQLKHYSRYYHVDLKYHLSSPSTHVQNVLNFIYHCLLYIQPVSYTHLTLPTRIRV